MTSPRLGFVASTGRTATMFLAATLGDLPGVTAFHEGHAVGEPPIPRLPLINLQNGPAWHDAGLAERTVAERRSVAVMERAATGDGTADHPQLVVDVAFYNAPLLESLARRHPGAHAAVVFRRCESFVRSATIVCGEDRQPAGWPDPAKPLTDRERFVALGRLRPRPGTDAADRWSGWSAIERNIWLWHAVNSRLATALDVHPVVPLFFEDLVDRPTDFWADCLAAFGLGPAHLDRCVQRSGTRLNDRPTYQVGPLSTWSADERALHERLALPLEDQLYARSARTPHRRDRPGRAPDDQWRW